MFGISNMQVLDCFGTEMPICNDCFVGKPWTKKVEEVRKELMDIGADAIVITALDEIAWLLNIRGRDIPYNPFLRSYVLLSLQEIHLYVDTKKLTRDVKMYLKTDFGVNPLSVM